MRKKLNIEVFIQLCILFGLAFMIFISLINGSIRNYVHPRIEILLWISGGVLIIMGFFMIPNLFKPRHCENIWSYTIIILPMIIVLIAHSSDMRENLSSNDKFSGVINNYELSNPEKDKGQSQNCNIITIKDEDFAKMYIDIYENREKYEGRKIEIKGQVSKQEEMKSNEFILARKVMVCCAADAKIYGFTCKSAKNCNLDEDEWIKIDAEIKWEIYGDEVIPILYTENIERTLAAKSEYIYFH